MPDALNNVDDAYALTPAQEGMLFHTISNRDSGVYVEQFTCLLVGKLDIERFQAAWDSVYAQHPALRAVFLWENLDEPLQVVRSTVQLPWTVEDWLDISEECQSSQLRDYLRRDRRAAFTLSTAPLARMFLTQLAETRWRFVWTFYHANLDGWSLGLVLSTVLDFYQSSASPVPTSASLPLSRPFSDYLNWIAEQDPAAAEIHWRNTLHDITEPTKIDFHSTPTNDLSIDPGRAFHTIGRELWNDLKSFARTQRITPNTVIHGGWAAVLSHYTGRDDVVFGSTVAGRPAALKGVEEMIGCFLNTLPLRVTLDYAKKLTDWLADIQERHLTLRQFEYSPLTSAQKHSQVPAGQVLFETIVVFENLAALPQGTNSINFDSIELLEQSNYPLALQAIPEEHCLRLILNYDSARYCPELAKDILTSFEVQLRVFAAHPGEDLARIVALTSAPDPRLKEWSRGPALPPDPPLVPARIGNQFNGNPDCLAAIHGTHSLTWGELDRRSSSVAAAIVANGAQPGQFVAVCLERGLEMIIGIVGILRAGCAYLPLDPKYPLRRLGFMLSDCGASVLVSRRGTCGSLGSHLRLDFEDIPDSPGFASTPVEPDQFAYAIYTSGSTGQPKGVGVTHRNLAASLAARETYYQHPPDRFLLLSSFSFDSSVAGLFWTLCTGGTLVLPGDRQEQDLDLVANLVATHSVTHTLCLPSLYALLLDHAPAPKLRSLRVVILAGEECPAAVCRRHHALLSKCELHNEYGPTEATVWCTAWRSASENVPFRIPIGRPIPGVDLHVLHPNRRPAPAGVPGELYVGGLGLAPGYLGRSELTSECFVPDPSDPTRRLYRTGDLACWLPDGNLLFLGRTDQQVKVRGHRIELAEIESVLAAHPAIAESVALAPAPQIPEDVESLLTALQQLDPADADALLTEVSH